MRKIIAAGNWKMHGTKASVAALIGGLRAKIAADNKAEIIVFPSFVHIDAVSELIAGSGMRLGAQNLSTEAEGAFTGEVSGAMLKDVGCDFVLVGHSERRTLYGETDALVAAKFDAARRSGLTPVLCIGETLDERESGTTEQVVGRQLDAVLEGAGVAALADAVVAYEPVWAIGTGKTASPQQAQDVHAFIRARVAARDATIAGSLQILYGGSVKGANAAELFSMADVDGGLVGGASLDATQFSQICAAAG